MIGRHVIFCGLLFISSAAAASFEYKSPLADGPWGPTNPIADPNAVILPNKDIGEGPNVRFTVLTDRVIRMEQGGLEDRKTLAVINRKLSVPKFTSITKSGTLTIITDYLHLQYTIGKPFSNDSLKITGVLTDANKTWTWKYDDPPDSGNLLGTIRTLDGLNIVSLNCSDYQSNMHCEPGLISRNGFSVVNDTSNWALDDDSDWWDSPNKNEIDLYMFGHGHDYKKALADYMKIGGSIPLLPRYAFGVFFSRWYDYNPASIRKVVEQYEQHTVPLDVFVLDMNWHTKNDWTGYSWDSALYYPSEDAIGYLKHRNLAVTLNVHDVDGVNIWETQYKEMCKAVSCNEGDRMNFTITNATVVYALEDIVLKPLEDVNGVDFWWLDWQQGEGRGGGDNNKKNPTIWTAHVRSTDRNRRSSQQRSMVLARWGGLGAHRYPVHFSGDAAISWEQLAFQPYFSMTAVNVGAIWSHDVAARVTDPELFTRWLQWASISGVTRTHDKGSSAGWCATKQPEVCTTVEPWNAPPKYAQANYKALRMRGMLLPYIYTAAYEAHKKTGLLFTRPLYYDYPELEGAYITAGPHPDNSSAYESQFLFGNDLLAAPVVRPANKTSGLAAMNLWIPPGSWIGFKGGRVVSGSSEEGSPLTIHVDLDEIPLFAKAGSVIPTIPVIPGSTTGLAMKQYTKIIWTVYLSSESPLTGNGNVYEDDGATTNYLSGQSRSTKASYLIDKEKGKIEFTVKSRGSPYDGVPSNRATMVRIVNASPPTKVLAMNQASPFSRFGGPGTWSYDSTLGAVVVEVPPMDASMTLTIEMDSSVGARNGAMDGLGFKISKALEAKETLDQIRQTPGTDKSSKKTSFLKQLASIGSSLEYLASDQEKFFAKVDSFNDLVKNAIGEIKDLMEEKRGGNVDVLSLRSQRWLMKEKEDLQVVNRYARAYALLRVIE